MIIAWVRDHRCAMLVVGPVLAVVLQAREVVLGNPLGSSLVSLDASAFIVFVTAASAVVALRSRVARVLLVRSAWWARLLWLSFLTAVTVLVLVAAASRPTGSVLVCQVAVLLWTPLVVCATSGEAVGLTAVFGLFVAHMLSPRSGPTPWWSPLLHHEARVVDLVATGLVLGAVSWLYVGNGGGRLNL